MKNIFILLSALFYLSASAQTNEFWGVTEFGGASDNGGTIFSTKDDGTNLVTRFSFPVNNPGSGPQKIQLTAYNNKLYGVTQNSGKFNSGVIFSYDPATNLYAKLYDFEYTTGANPATSLVLVNGKFYGTARSGGSASLTSSLGVIFEFDPITLIYTKKITFTGTSGSALGNLPVGSMVEKGGKLYGTTFSGGTNNGGVLFEYDPNTNNYIVKQNIFLGNGNGPNGNLLEFNNNLYGTCTSGGANGAGVLFQYDLTTNLYTVKYNMVTLTGNGPSAGVAVYNGKLYGINQYGGTNSRGSIFEYDLATNTYQIVYNYTDLGGSNPESELFLYNNIFYGFAIGGGSNNLGSIYKFDPLTYRFTKTYDFPGPISPSARGVFFNYNNILYATTTSNGDIGIGGGTIISYNPGTDAYTKKLILNTDGASGNRPTSKLLYYNSKIYGSTVNGGANNGGVLFEFNPATNVYTKLLDLSLTTTGTNLGPLIERNGILYGNMQFYQASGLNYGAIFAYNPTNNMYSVRSFNSTSYSQPKGQLVDNGDGTLTGIATSKPGVSTSAGGVFKYTISSNTINAFVQNVPTANGNFLQDIRLYNNNYYILGSTTNNSDAGSIMENSIAGSFNTRATFNTSTTGTRPTGFLTPFNGKLYGVSSSGLFDNLNKQGTIVEYDPLPPYTLTRKYEFAAATGQRPTTGLLAYNNKFYGLTQTGGTTGYDPVGVLYEFDPTTNIYTQKITFNYANGASPNIAALIAAPTGSVLPIKLTNFSAKENDGSSKLNWATSFELNNKGFNIQHSADAVTFSSVGFVKSQGNSNTTAYYNFTHYNPSIGRNYYRLQQIDIDGKITYSKIEMVELKKSKGSISIYPNPTSEVINIRSNEKISFIELVDVSGRIIQSFTSQTKLDVRMLTKGMYLLKVWLASGEKIEEKIIVNK